MGRMHLITKNRRVPLLITLNRAGFSIAALTRSLSLSCLLIVLKEICFPSIMRTSAFIQRGTDRINLASTSKPIRVAYRGESKTGELQDSEKIDVLQNDEVSVTSCTERIRHIPEKSEYTSYTPSRKRTARRMLDHRNFCSYSAYAWTSNGQLDLPSHTITQPRHHNRRR